MQFNFNKNGLRFWHTTFYLLVIVGARNILVSMSTLRAFSDVEEIRLTSYVVLFFGVCYSFLAYFVKKAYLWAAVAASTIFAINIVWLIVGSGYLNIYLFAIFLSSIGTVLFLHGVKTGKYTWKIAMESQGLGKKLNKKKSK